MRRTERLYGGILKRETEFFISKRFDHIEVSKVTTLFGRWKVREETHEVFLPSVEITEQGKLRVIAEAYMELHSIITELRNGGLV